MFAVRFWLTVILLGTILKICNAHDAPVHEKIAESAVNSSSGLSQFLAETAEGTNFVFNPAQFGSKGLSPIVWIEQGAIREDDFPRFSDHFYTLVPLRQPGHVKGLTDRTESFFVLPGGITNSFAWGNVPGIIIPHFLPSSETNTETWECARAYELAALTNSAQSDRDAFMAHMFYSLGHILHLNQDLSQPDHVRNDEHLLKWHRWIENFSLV